jgi:hypothetical protein
MDKYRKAFERAEAIRIAQRNERIFYERKRKAFAKLERVLNHMRHNRALHRIEAIVVILDCIRKVAEERIPQ